MNEIENVFNEVVEEDNIEKQEEQTESKPKRGDPEWHDYVMSLLSPSEKDGDAPKCDGLRRLTEVLVGPIVKRSVNCVQAPNHPQGIATVSVSVSVYDKSNGFTIVEESIADAGLYNTEAKYALHQSATAETRAEARALRKLLRLRQIAAEERAPEHAEDNILGWQPEEPITEEQINLMDLLGSRCNISVMDLCNAGKNKYDSINMISKAKAAEIIAFMNRIQQKDPNVKLPSSVGKYQSDWRN